MARRKDRPVPEDTAPSITTDGKPSPPSVTVVRVEGAPRLLAASVGPYSFEFGDGDGPWTMDAALWTRLSADRDVAASFAVKE